LFRLGSQLGDENFYAFFFSFWFWNIDGAVGRRVILVWNLVMYIGQVGT
jgi:sphingosine-1-phosphate phosphatase 1